MLKTFRFFAQQSVGAAAQIQLHGFLNYLVKCAATNTHYTVFGHNGKQVQKAHWRIA